MIPEDSQNLESYVPIYDVVPEKWEEARPFLVEQLKKITIAVNTREIGWFLDQELLSGKSFIPGVNNSTANSGTNQSFRSILRKVIDFGPITIGLNQRAHGIVVDANFTLITLWGAATVSASSTALQIPSGGGDAISIDAVNINIISIVNADRCFAFVEFLQEL